MIAKPLTLMNQSGFAAARLANRYEAAPSDFIVAYDDVALPLGTIRVRASGRAAGQKGMDSIIRSLGSNDIPRVRLGILGERGQAELSDYVLEPFARSEREIAEEMIDRAAEAIVAVLVEGIHHAMNAYNRRGEGRA